MSGQGRNRHSSQGFRNRGQGNLEVGGNTEALVRNLLKHFPPPTVPGKQNSGVAGGCSKFPVSPHFHKQSRPAWPLGSLASGPASLPSTFWLGFPMWAELGYLQPLLAVSHPPSVGRLNRDHTGLQIDIPPLDSKPKCLLLAQPAKAQSSCGRGDVCSWLFQLKPDHPVGEGEGTFPRVTYPYSSGTTSQLQ